MDERKALVGRARRARRGGLGEAALPFLASLAVLAASAAQVTVETTLLDGRKTSVVQPLEVRDGRAAWRMTRADVPANVKSIAVWPDFAEARKGEDGYWVMPNNMYGTYRLDEGVSLTTGASICRCSE